MEQNIEGLLALEIKKEIADRYFGFRKLIEEDIKEYDNQILRSSSRLERKIGFDLVKLYILLKDRELIHEFFDLIGLRQLFFFDPYITESPTIRKRVFAKARVHGLTKGSRFKNLVMDTYESLAAHVENYRENHLQLSEEWETISEEIKLFYKQNDLSTIMGFFRSLDGNAGYKSGDMEGGLNPQADNALENKMRVHPPPPVEQLLPNIPHLPPIAHIRKPMKKIIDQAFKIHHQADWRELIQK